MIRYIGALIIPFIFACGSENTGKQSEAWYNTCSEKVEPIVSDSSCGNIYTWKCKDGMVDVYYLPAEASNWIGSVCSSTDYGANNYYFVCGLNDKNEAFVYCDYRGSK